MTSIKKNNFGGRVGSNATITTMSREELMKNYDSLPREYRDLLKDTFVAATILRDNLLELDQYRRYFEEAQKQSTLVTYGQDHPQAA